MNSDFPTILSTLRKSKGISQRQAAENLQVSQALLSHYENGIREPGFDFLVRVGEYYGISIDYLLGRTKIRQNPFLADQIMPKFSAGMSDEVLAKLNEESRLLLTALSLTFTLLARTSGEDGIEYASRCFKTQIYHVFRIMKLYLGEDGFEQIELSMSELDPACDMETKSSFIKLARHLSTIARSVEREDGERIHFSEEVLKTRFSSIIGSLMEVVEATDKRLTNITESNPG